MDLLELRYDWNIARLIMLCRGSCTYINIMRDIMRYSTTELILFNWIGFYQVRNANPYHLDCKFIPNIGAAIIMTILDNG